MKCISVHQPWAYLLAAGRRKIEVRSWDTKYRGPILIHAGLTVEWDEYERLNLPDTKKLNWDMKQLVVGSRFRKPMPYLGRLGLFDVPSKLIRQKRLPINYTPVVIRGQTFYKPEYKIPD